MNRTRIVACLVILLLGRSARRLVGSASGRRPTRGEMRWPSTSAGAAWFRSGEVIGVLTPSGCCTRCTTRW